MCNPPKRTVGAVPACPPERLRSGVSIIKTRALCVGIERRFHTKHTRIVRGDLMMDAPLQGDTGGHTGTAPTHLHHIFPRNPTQTK